MRLFFLLPLWLAVSAFASCSLEARLKVLPDGGGDVRAKVSVGTAFFSYWRDLRDFDSQLPATPLDLPEWRASLLKQAQAVPPKLTSPTVRAEGSGALVAFQLPELSGMLGSHALGRVTKKEGATELLLTLDRNTFRELAGLTTWGNSPALATFLPREKNRVTEAEMAELLAYFLEPYDAASAILVANSDVVLVLELPLAPRSAEGAASVSGSTVTFRWPLARVLSLQSPITVRVIY